MKEVFGIEQGLKHMKDGRTIQNRAGKYRCSKGVLAIDNTVNEINNEYIMKFNFEKNYWEPCLLTLSELSADFILCE